MQFKTSCCNKTLLKKDLTRFAPLWGLYTLGLLLWLMLSWDRQQEAYFSAANFVAQFPGLIVVNLGYGALTAAVLFGDLYNTRMCYGTHALPMTRGCWFGTHILSGLLFSLIPTVVLTAVSMPLLASVPVPNGWQLSLYWFLSTNLEYLIFFGLGVFSAMCAGNWLGLAAIYGLLNFGSMIVCLLVEKLFTPLLFGVVTPRHPFEALSPFYNLAERDLIIMHSNSAALPDGTLEYFGTFTLGDGWSALAVLALVGVVLLAFAYLLYRRRNLETAGDFLAIDLLKPIVGVCLALTGAGFALLVVALFDYGNYTDMDRMFFSLVGLAVGWFGGQMFLSRSTRVFYPRKWLGLAVLTAVIAAAMGLTKLDPLGFTDWVPQASELKNVYIRTEYFYNCPIENQQEIETVLRLHELSIREHWTEKALRDRAVRMAEENPDAENRWLDYTLTYENSNGWISERTYCMPVEGEGADMLRELLSTPSAIFARYENSYLQIRTADDLMALVQKPQSIYMEDAALAPEMLTEETVRSLFQAIIADCEAGNLAQAYELHPLDYFENERGDLTARASYWISVSLNREVSFNLDFYSDSENMLAWAESVGITLDMIRGVG